MTAGREQDAARDHGPRLLFPAVYIDTTSNPRNIVRVSRQLDAVHVQWRWPDRYDYEAVRRALLWG